MRGLARIFIFLPGSLSRPHKKRKGKEDIRGGKRGVFLEDTWWGGCGDGGFGRDERVKGDMWEGRGEDEEGVSEWLR